MCQITENTLGFMYVHQNINCNEFQHILTQEAVEIVNLCADVAQKYIYQPVVAHYLQHTCDLAIVGQQFNQLSSVEQAVVLLDCAFLFSRYGQRTLLLIDRVQEVVKQDPIKVEKFRKDIVPYLRSDKIINVERLKSIESIEQIQKFKDYTDGFKNLDILTSEEILYLNLCDWLEPKSRAINAEIQAMGGLKFIDPETQMEVIVETLDLFHSLLGEMKPGNLKKCVSGGHLFIPELRAATLEIGGITIFGDGFLDVAIRVKSNGKLNSYFPPGTLVEESVDMLKNSVKNPTKIVMKILEEKTFINIKDKFNHCFRLVIENNRAKFHPLHPSLFTK